MKSSQSLLWVAVVVSGALWGAVGCVKPGDTVHEQFKTFDVRRVGTVVWCARCAHEGICGGGMVKVGNVDKIRPEMDMTCDAECNKYLSPRILSHIEATLRDKGYEVVDVHSNIRLGKNVTLKANLDAVAKSADVDAVLVVAYNYSPLFYSQDISGFGGVSTHANSQSVALFGRLKLFHAQSGEELWALGDGDDYLYHSPLKGQPKYTSPEDLADPVCKEFGTRFGRPGGKWKGIPARNEATPKTEG
jgi:hypothetical protein